MSESKREVLLEIFHRMYRRLGPQHWWPADGQFEVIVGAILTQNTAWENAYRAIMNLKNASLLHPKAILDTPTEYLASMIKPSGYYNQKAKKLKNFCLFLDHEYKNDLGSMFQEDIPVLREKLLAIKGIGPETADSILLYAGNKPVFVVDTYTFRILSRHQIVPEETTYEEIQEVFMMSLDRDVELFKEFHALLVVTGKNHCKKAAKCSGCPLENFTPGISLSIHDHGF